MFQFLMRRIYSSRRRNYPTFLGFCIFVILVFFALFHFNLIPDALNPNIIMQPLEAGKESTDMGKCVVPQLDPFRSEMMNLFKKLPKLECKGKRFAEVIGRQLRLKTEGLKEGTLQYIRRPHQDDFNFELSTPIPINFKNKDKNGDMILEPAEEFIQLKLTLQDGKTVTELHTVAIQKPNNKAKSESKEGLGFNVAFILIDSISSGSFHRAMPQSLQQIKNIPTSVIFKGQTIVGDGTTAQLCAIYTGINEQFLPEARRGFDGAVTVDKWPLIYKDFKKNSYATMFSEDMPRFATFNYRLKGFKEPPADHYLRHFFLAAEKIKEEYCIASKGTHLYSLDYLMQFYDAYPDTKKFSSSIMADIPHNSLHNGQIMDTDLAKFIADFDKKGHLDNTMLVIFGDHGPRISVARSSINGKLEERLPFMSIIMPKSFKTDHEEFFNAMKANANVLTSYFDMHATLKHILEYPKIPKVPTGQSLFLKIDPDTRNCHTAGVADHWCPCLGYHNMSVDDPDIKNLALKAVSHVNSIITAISKAQTLCSELKLKKIIRAGKVAHNSKMVNFARTKSNGRCGSCMLVFNKGDADLPQTYEIVFAVSPSDGMYEVNVSVEKGNVFIDPNISRINLYGSQPQCVAKDYPHLRKYCYCVK